MTRAHVLYGWIGASAVLVCVGSVGPWWSGFNGLDQDGMPPLVAGAGALALLVAYVAVPWRPRRPRWPLVAIVAAGLVAGAVGAYHWWRIEFGDIRAFRDDLEEAGIDLGGLGPRWGLVLMTLAALSLTIAALVALLWQRRTAATLAGARVPSDVVSSAFQRTGKRVDPVTGAALASWPRRAAGGLVDALVVLFLCSIVIVVVGAAEAFANPETDDISDTSVLILLLAILLIPPLYQWLLIGKWGRTLGKKAVGVKVLRGNDAGRVSYPRALQRALAFEVLGIVPFLLVVAFLWPLWDDRCQTLYDKVAGTIVVRLRGSE